MNQEITGAAIRAPVVSARAFGRRLAVTGRRLAGLLACLALVVVAGCALPGQPAVVELSMMPSADLNPDGNGRPSPVVLRVYRLASDSAFRAADFFQLYEKEASTLGPDLLGRDELMLLPGEGQTLRRELEPDTRFVGVAVFYRDFETAGWRAVAPVAPNGTTEITASVGALSVSLDPSEP
ncbi:type VI secretion system lipoprotein TssJ [Rhodospirillaceae bacterium SYSU D60014]|uniref:type VI secretion system lipoprotein TssJ n=1 Tax=Virgifigura deserti TaxID=2268457 RepID=UPI0013C4A618